MSKYQIVGNHMSRLICYCRYLDDVALHHLIDALCKLSAESMELAYSNRVSSLAFKPVLSNGGDAKKF